MDIIIFRKVFNNSILNKLIFRNVHHIFVDILKIEKTFKWNGVLKSRYILAGNGYLNQLKEYYRINNNDDLKSNRNDTVLLNAFKSKSLDIIKFIIEELHYDYNSHGCFENSQYLRYASQDLLYIASKYGNIEIVQYIDSLKLNKYNSNYNSNNRNWDYIESFRVSPLSKDIKVLQYNYNRLIENNIFLHNKIIKYAILNSLSIDRIDFVEWLLTLSNTIDVTDIHQTDKNLVLKAAENGYLDTIKWLHFNNKGGLETHKAMENAASNGHFEIVKWLHNNRTEGCTTDAINNAAKNGYFEIVKWLHENRTEGCTTHAMNYAARHGHFEIVKWLHQNRTEGCTTHAMNNAALNGYFEIVKWLDENRTEGCTTDAMDYAAWKGYFEIIKWLHENRTEGCTTNAMDNAAKNGHFEIVKWLHHNRTEGCTTHAMNYAAKNGHFEIDIWLRHNRY